MNNLKKFSGIIITVFFLTGYFFYKIDLNLSTDKKVQLVKEMKLNFNLIDISKTSGINFNHGANKINKAFENVEPWFSSFGASFSLVDQSGDGWYDVFFLTQKIGEPNHYYRNNHDGTFTEIANKLNLANINKVWPSYRSIFFDYDRDGLKDLLLLSYLPRVFHNDGSKGYTEVLNPGIAHGTPYGGANLIEQNSSGKLDLIISPYINEDLYYNPKSTIVMPDNFSSAANGTNIQFYEYLDKGKFNLMPNEKNGLLHIGWGHALGVFDIRGSGQKDLWFPEDNGIEKIYFKKGFNLYNDVSSKLFQLHYGFGRNGMSVDFADVDNDGHPLIFVTHIFEPSYKLSGNNLWKWIEDTHFEQQADSRGVQNCGWAWGSRFIDFDNDSNLDLVVVNGYISNNPKKSYWYSTSVMDSSGAFIMKDSKNWPKMKDSSFAGFQKTCLFYNNQKGEFLDISSKTDLNNDLSDGRAVAGFDILNNGQPGLIIANQKGAAKIYLNQPINNKNKWIGFKFHGTKSNIDGWGTIVKVILKNKTITRELEPLNGHGSQSEDRILIGLGENPEVKKIIIQWPSQKLQTFDRLELNKYHKILESM